MNRASLIERLVESCERQMGPATERGFTIKRVLAREILDSRGNPTIEVDVVADSFFGRSSVPSGASTGAHEAREFRDGDNTRFQGKGVLRAVENVNRRIAPKILGMDCRRQDEIDKAMVAIDGTESKAVLGANAILAVSLAVAKLAAKLEGKSVFRYLAKADRFALPVPMMNVINGGKHAGNELNIQEFMILPVNAATFKDALRMCVEVYHSLGELLRKEYGKAASNVGDEGGYAPPMSKTCDALESLMRGIEATGYRPGKDVVLALDAAATNFYDPDLRKYSVDGHDIDRDGLLEFYRETVNTYPIFSIEDPFEEDDFDGFAQITKELGKRAQIVGDDLFVTNVKRLRKGIEARAANGLLLKVNQIGTLTEAMDAAELAFANNMRVIVSHRSGETDDPFIADLAVGIGAQEIKAGAPARGERVAKYNQLLRIEEELGPSARYLGRELAAH